MVKIMTRIAIILAGGKASRMGGQDKGEIKLGGTRLIDLVLERLKPQVDKIIISGLQDYGTELDTMPDLNDGPKGPSAALFAMLKTYPDVKAFMTVPIDGPFFPSELYERLSGGGSAIAQGPDREHPTFAHWKRQELLSVFTAHAGEDLALHKIAEETAARKVSFRAESYFRNFNSPDDLNIEI